VIGVATLVLAASPVAVGAGAGFGWLPAINDPYVGDNSTIAEALGSTAHESSTDHAVPMLWQALYRREPIGKMHLGIELTERWWRVWSEGVSSSVSASSHRIDRSVIAIDAQARAAFEAGRPNTFVVAGVGPALYWIGTRERGWLGNQAAIDYAPGVRGSAGFRVMPATYLGIVVELSLETFRLPRRNVLLDDGGQATSVSFNVRVEGWL
jgi:hypothetical protein